MASACTVHPGTSRIHTVLCRHTNYTFNLTCYYKHNRTVSLSAVTSVRADNAQGPPKYNTQILLISNHQGNTVPYTYNSHAESRMYPVSRYKLQYITVNRTTFGEVEPRRIHSRMFKARRPCVARFVAPPGRTHSTRDAQRALRISPCGPTTLATPAPPPAARPATCAACCRRGEPPRGAGPG